MKQITIMTMQIREEPECCLYCPCLTYCEGKRHCGACGRELDDAAAYQRRPDVCPAKFTTFEEGEPMKTLMIESEGPVKLVLGGKVWTIRERKTDPSTPLRYAQDDKGRAAEDPHPALRATFPQGKAGETAPQKREMMEVMDMGRRNRPDLEDLELGLYAFLAATGIALDLILAWGRGLI